MPLSTEERIATNGLLIEREAAYAHVAGLEAQINQLLEGGYPFSAPKATPPSLLKRKAPKNAKPKKQPTSKPIKLRRLKDDECAYQYTWSERGIEHVATAIDARKIEVFVKNPLEGVSILKIDALDIDGKEISLLYSNHDPDL